MTACMRMFTLAIVASSALALRGDGPDAAAQRTADAYASRTVEAADALNQTRARVLAEKAPLLDRMRAAEERILRAGSELTRLETGRENSGEERRKLVVELDGIRKTTTYVDGLAREGLKAARDGLAPGEDQVCGEVLRALEASLGNGGDPAHGVATLAAAEFLVGRIEDVLGGYRARGRAMLSDSRQVLEGTFVFVGPEAFFQPDADGPAGAVRPREGATVPVSYSLPAWAPLEARRFFAGEPGSMLADASEGKALKLLETTGSVWDHVRKGGVVAFAILGVGLLAAVLIAQKVCDLWAMGVDDPAAVNAVLDRISGGAAVAAVDGLQRSTRELFEEGMRYRDHAKSVLEEKLAAILLTQRLRYERRLPLLAVIATAAPLMGLLGTVVGMVKTFALITVFGTGNAAKLSSGISEVLVATELGLAVAIPTLVAHGFLAHRIQRKLSLQERYALQCVTAIDMGTTVSAERPAKETVLA